jgi:hypothetical protein
MRYLVSFVFILLLTGCGVYSQHPITPFDKTQIDSKLFGSWFWLEKNESGYIHIGMDDKSERLKILMVGVNKDGEINIMEFEGHSSQVGENHYLNLKQIQPKAERNDNYMIIKYSITSNELKIGLMDDTVVAEAIKAKGLKGKVEGKKYILNVYITEKEEVLQKFFLDHDSIIFHEMKALEKVDLSKMK